jgi:hypothetical protein
MAALAGRGAQPGTSSCPASASRSPGRRSRSLRRERRHAPRFVRKLDRKFGNKELSECFQHPQQGPRGRSRGRRDRGRFLRDRRRHRQQRRNRGQQRYPQRPRQRPRQWLRTRRRIQRPVRTGRRGHGAGTVTSVSSSGFTVETWADEKATIKEQSSTTYEKAGARPGPAPSPPASPSWSWAPPTTRPSRPPGSS